MLHSIGHSALVNYLFFNDTVKQSAPLPKANALTVCLVFLGGTLANIVFKLFTRLLIRLKKRCRCTPLVVLTINYTRGPDDGSGFIVLLNGTII
jgi:hypothetical protein